MPLVLNKLLALSLVVLTIIQLCSCAPQSYYSSSSSYLPDRTSAGRASSYRRADYTPYRDYNREYYEALKQRRMRALADSYRGLYNSPSTNSDLGSSSNNNVNTKTQSYYSSSRLPAVSAAINAGSNQESSVSNNKDPYYNNYNRYDVYASNNNRLTDNTAVRQQDATATTTTQRPRVSKADAENAKFVGIRNQEANDEDTPKTAGRRFRHKKRRRCLAFGLGRDAQGNEVTPPPEEQGRILWDLNVYNIYSTPPVYGGGSGCGGFGGGGLASAFAGAGAGGLGGGGLFSDPIEAAYAPPNRLSNFLQFFAPGILQNALAATARPQAFRPQADAANDVDPNVDANYNPVAARPVPVRQPNRVYYDSAGAPPVTPAQLVGGVATTVNGIIQQLTGNVQPVYPGRRSLSYGK